MEWIKKIAKLLCLCMIVLFVGLFFCKDVRAENLELDSERNSKYKYNMHEFCNSEVMSFIRHAAFYFDTDIGLSRFLDGENYYLKYNTNNYEASGNILVLGSQGDTISSMIAENEIYFLENAYYGQNRVDHINLTYLNPEEITTDDLNGYDMIIIEESVEDCYISEELFFYMDQMINDNQYIIYDKSMLNQYHSKETYGMSCSFEPSNGELILFNCGIYKNKLKNEVKKSFEELLCSLYDKDLINGGAFQFSVDDVRDIVVINSSSTISYAFR